MLDLGRGVLREDCGYGIDPHRLSIKLKMGGDKT